MDNALRERFDVGEACTQIRSFNQDLMLAATDFLTAQHFKPYEVLSEEDAAAAILTIDGLWSTQLFREPRGRERMFRLYREKAGACARYLQQLGQISLQESPGDVYRIARPLLAVLLPPDEAGRKNYSFATKFFHWHAPEHLPIVDSRTRRAINALQRECKQREGIVLSDTAEMGGRSYIEEYRRWMDFYSALLKALKPEDRERLLAAERDSLPAQFRIQNSLLRILDKVFYFRGAPP